MMHNKITFNPNAMETVPTLHSEVDITSLLDDVQRTVQAACSIWWTPVRLQVMTERIREAFVVLLSHQNLGQNILTLSTPANCTALSKEAMWGTTTYNF